MSSHNICCGEISKVFTFYSLLPRAMNMWNLNIKRHFDIFSLPWKYYICIFTSTLNIDIMGLYHTYPKNWTSPVDYLLIYPKLCWLNGIQCRPWSDAAFYDIQYKSLLFTLTGISIGILADHLWIWQRWQYAWNVKPFFLLKNKKQQKNTEMCTLTGLTKGCTYF